MAPPTTVDISRGAERTRRLRTASAPLTRPPTSLTIAQDLPPKRHAPGHALEVCPGGRTVRGHAPLALIALLFLATSCTDSPGADRDVPEGVTGPDLVEGPDGDLVGGADGVVPEVADGDIIDGADGGVTGPDLVEVGPHEVAEVEPNEDPAHATRFEAGDTLVGHVGAGASTRDTWVVRLERGTLLTLTEELPVGEHRLQLAIAYAGPLTIPFMDRELAPTMGAAVIGRSPSGRPSRFFIPYSGDYFVTLVDIGSPAVAYRVATAGETPIPVPLDSTLPIELPVTGQQTVYRFTAPTDVVLASHWMCPEVDHYRGGRWSPGTAWAYHPDDATVRVVYGGWTAMVTAVYGCGVPLRKGQTALLVSPYSPFDDGEFSWGTLHDDGLYSLPVGSGTVVDGDLVAADPGDYFLLDDLSEARVTLTLETEPPTGNACLGLLGLARYDRHGPQLFPLGDDLGGSYKAVAGAEGRATLTFTPGLLGLLASVDSVYVSVGFCGPWDARPTFGYHLSVASVGLELTPVPPEGAFALDLGAGETRHLRTTVPPESCTYGQALVDLERSRPIALTTNHGGCANGDLFACASAESGPQPALLGVAATDGAPAVVHLFLASRPLVPPDAPVVEDAADNGPYGTPQRLVPPVVVAIGPAAGTAQDRFRVALSGGEVVLVTLDRAALPDPACSLQWAWVALPQPSWQEGCAVRFPTHPGWSPWDVDGVVSSTLGYPVMPQVSAHRAPAPMDLEIQVNRTGDSNCSSLEPYTLGLTILPAPVLGAP
jgi:hypothetical protein